MERSEPANLCRIRQENVANTQNPARIDQNLPESSGSNPNIPVVDATSPLRGVRAKRGRESGRDSNGRAARRVILTRFFGDEPPHASGGCRCPFSRSGPKGTGPDQKGVSGNVIGSCSLRRKRQGHRGGRRCEREGQGDPVSPPRLFSSSRHSFRHPFGTGGEARRTCRRLSAITERWPARAGDRPVQAFVVGGMLPAVAERRPHDFPNGRCPPPPIGRRAQGRR